MEKIDLQWIRSTWEACLQQVQSSSWWLLLLDKYPMPQWDNESAAASTAALALFLYLTGSVVWNWSSPCVRWAFQQYLHTSNTSSSSSAVAARRRKLLLPSGLLYGMYLVQNTLASVVRFWSHLFFSAAFHLPPLAVCLLLLAPYSRLYYSSDDAWKGDGEVERSKNLNRVARYVLDELSTRCFFLVTVLVATSWIHELVLRKRRLAPLPLPPEYRNLDRALLPPFLPDDNDEDDEESAPAIYREGVMQYLVSLQEVKDGARNDHNGSDPYHHRALPPSSPSTDNSGEMLGYAVVTGASRGIGRAIAVELARHGFPLVLIARDRDRLMLLAKDLHDCYGVRCCVVAYDLASSSDAPDKVHNLIVRKAGLKVDVLVKYVHSSVRSALFVSRIGSPCGSGFPQFPYSVAPCFHFNLSNAGIASQGISMDLPKNRIDNMIALNVSAVSSLTHLFGRDMKERGRGRILIVSSMCGLATGIASVAVYSATKAFERSFCNSLSLEMEPFGVGVTCLVPGAVRDTDFRTSTQCQQALVWKVPFCSTTAPIVAAQGVRAMLRGETEVIVGLANRVFGKVLQPLLPQRLHNLVATLAWNPIHIPFASSRKKNSNDIAASSTTDRPIVTVDPRIGRACRDSDVLVLNMEGWTAKRGWRTETGQFDELLQDLLQSSPAPSRREVGEPTRKS
jgi:hypothetical protein